MTAAVLEIEGDTRDLAVELRRAGGEAMYSGSDVTVVVCTHSFARRQMLTDLVASIADGAVQPREVVVVVDRNVPLHDDLAAATWPVGLRVIRSPGAGLADARNAGWRAAETPLVAFIDDDAIASPDWLARLIDALWAHGADIVGGRIDPRWTGPAPAWYSARLGWVVGCTYEGLPVTTAPVRNVIGCNMLMTRAVLERLDGFHPALGRSGTGLDGAEETELCIRANAGGGLVLYVPTARVEQVLPPERATLRHAVRRSWSEGRSKQRLVSLHGRVLDVESRYAWEVVGAALRNVADGVIHARLAEIVRGVSLAVVLGVTGVSYVFHRTTAPRSRNSSA